MAFLRTAIRCSVFYRKYGGGGGSNLCFCFQQKALKSSAAATASNIIQDSKTATAPSQKDPLDITFEDAKAAFKSKTNWELIRGYIVYTLCSFEYLVDNNMKVSWFYASYRFSCLVCYIIFREGVGAEWG